MAEPTQTELEAAAFRKLVAHLRERTDVQNIDLMNLAGFCRNCLSRWYREAAEERGMKLPDPEARKIVYGMPYDEWKAKYPRKRRRRRKPRSPNRTSTRLCSQRTEQYSPSSLRKQGPRAGDVRLLWTPAFAGVTK